MRQLKIGIEVNDRLRTNLSKEIYYSIFQLISELSQGDKVAYSLYLTAYKDESFLVVNLLQDKYLEMITTYFLNLDGLNLYGDQYLPIISVEIFDLSVTQLFQILQENVKEQIFVIHFLSPTIFSNDDQAFPELYSFFRELMTKQYELLGQGNNLDFELLEHLMNHSKIISYNIQSKHIPNLARGFPAFTGKITIKVTGAKTLRAYLKMLLTLVEFTGLGLENQNGLGGIRFDYR